MKIEEQQPFNQDLFQGKHRVNLCALGAYHSTWHLSTKLMLAELMKSRVIIDNWVRKHSILNIGPPF